MAVGVDRANSSPDCGCINRISRVLELPIAGILDIRRRLVPISIRAELEELTTMANLVHFKGRLAVLLLFVCCKITKESVSITWDLGATLDHLVEKNSHLWRKISVTKVLEEFLFRPAFRIEMATDYIVRIVPDLLGDIEQRDVTNIFLILREGNLGTATWRACQRPRLVGK
jgi:hypothetical protein